MKLSKLQRVEQPKPIEPEWKMCVACEAYRAECYVPVGENSAQMCWLCAHHVAAHDCLIERAATAECECLPHQIYPNRAHPAVLNGTYVERPQYVGKASERWDDMRVVHGDVHPAKAHPDDWKSMHLYNQNSGCIDTFYRGELIDSTPVAPVAENAPRRKSS